MATSFQIPVADYLASVYRPDCEYIDGELIERNVGERDHSSAQMRLSAYLFHRSAELGIHVYPEQRVQVHRNRYRVPNICVVLGDEPEGQVFTAPPFLCIEILSRGDTMTSLQERVRDYLDFGVAFVWMVDPRRRCASIYTKDRMIEAQTTLLTSNPEIAVPLSAIFPG